MSERKKINVSKAAAAQVLRRTKTQQTAQQFSSQKQPKVLPLSTHSRKHKVPGTLESLIAIVNSLPSDLPTSREIWARAEEMHERGITVEEAGRDLWLWLPGTDRPISALEWAVRMFVDFVNTLDTAAQDFIGQLHPETGLSWWFEPLRSTREFPAEATLAASANRYDFLLIARNTLRTIADKWASGSDPQAIIPVEALRHKEEAATPLALRLDNKGRIARHHSELLDWLYNDILKGVIAERILRCPICSKIYWAERIDQPTCSLRCNNIRRSRIQRRTYVETRPRFQQKTEKKVRREKKHGS